MGKGSLSPSTYGAAEEGRADFNGIYIYLFELVYYSFVFSRVIDGACRMIQDALGSDKFLRLFLRHYLLLKSREKKKRRREEEKHCSLYIDYTKKDQGGSRRHLSAREYSENLDGGGGGGGAVAAAEPAAALRFINFSQRQCQSHGRLLRSTGCAGLVFKFKNARERASQREKDSPRLLSQCFSLRFFFVSVWQPSLGAAKAQSIKYSKKPALG